MTQWSKSAASRDLLASVVVFLVALPLCMGIAIASGAPPAAGILTGIVGGLVVGLLGGAPLQVSGPAAGLAVIVWDLVQTHGLPTLGVIVLGAGVFQMLAGVLKLGRWFQAVPPSVIYGMLAGIGVLIFASQFHVMVDDAPKHSGLANLVSIPTAVWKGVVPRPDSSHDDAALLGVATIGTIGLWNGVVVRRLPKAKALPGALVGVVVTTVVAQALRSPVAYVELPSDLLANLQLPTGETLAKLADVTMLGASAGLAVVASAETLLCATATDRMHDGPRTRYDREMFAQGVGNALSGLLGGLPMTGVIVRSSANVHAGAKTRLSAILHGAWLLLAVAAVPFVLRLVPVSALAALLVFTGYKLVRQDVQALRERGGRYEVFVFLATVTGIVVTDLLKGVALGLVLALAKIVWMFTRLRIEIQRSDALKRTTLSFEGSATFVRLPELTAALASIPSDHEVHLRLGGLTYVDHAAYDALEAWEQQQMTHGGKVFLNWAEIEFLAQRPRPGGGRRAAAPPAPIGAT